MNEETKSLSTHQILKLIHESIDSKQYSSFIHFIRKDIDSDCSVDNDSQNDSNQSDSFGFSSRIKGEKLTHMQTKYIKQYATKSNLSTRELSNKF